jgi:hypothetical protein
MKSREMFWGILLVGFGALFLLRNFGVIDFSWHQLRMLWPLVIILVGIAILPVKNFVRILTALAVIILAIVFLSRLAPADRYSKRWIPQGERFFDADRNSKKHSMSRQLLSESYNPEIENAILELDAVAGEFILNETTDQLLKFEKEGDLGDYTLISEEAGNSMIMRLQLEGGSVNRVSRFNNATIFLNPRPVWDIRMDAGAAKIDLDLQQFRINRVEIDGGASSVKVKLGDKQPVTNLRVNAGATSLVIEVPKSAGCEVIASTVLTRRSLQGFINEGDNTFRTANFEQAENRIMIRVDAAVANFRVVRY